MNSFNIYYSRDFKDQWDKLPQAIKGLAAEKESILKDNPLHPSLRLHPLKGKLKGLWSITVSMQYRIIFKIEGKDIIFISIGKHDIYRNL